MRDERADDGRWHLLQANHVAHRQQFVDVFLNEMYALLLIVLSPPSAGHARRELLALLLGRYPANFKFWVTFSEFGVSFKALWGPWSTGTSLPELVSLILNSFC